METYSSSYTAQDLENAIKAVPSIGENGNWYIGDEDTGVYASGINVSGAEVGQTIKVTAVDDSGKPTAWEAADLPKGEEWEVIAGTGGVIDSGSYAGGTILVSAAGTSSVVWDLGKYYKKLHVHVRGNTTPICTSGNINLHWGDANANCHNLGSVAASSAWTSCRWMIEFCKGFAFYHLNTTAANLTRESHGGWYYPNTNKLTLKTVSSDATFNDFYLEIWGVPA